MRKWKVQVMPKAQFKRLPSRRQWSTRALTGMTTLALGLLLGASAWAQSSAAPSAPGAGPSGLAAQAGQPVLSAQGMSTGAAAAQAGAPDGNAADSNAADSNAADTKATGAMPASPPMGRTYLQPGFGTSQGLLGPGLLESLQGGSLTGGLDAGVGLSAKELLGPEILPYFKQLPKERQDRLRQLHVSMMQVLLQQRAALQAQLLGLRETLHGFPVDAERAGKQFLAIQDARNAMFHLLLNGLAQQQRLLGQADWERLHGLHGPEAAQVDVESQPSPMLQSTTPQRTLPQQSASEDGESGGGGKSGAAAPAKNTQ